MKATLAVSLLVLSLFAAAGCQSMVFDEEDPAAVDTLGDIRFEICPKVSAIIDSKVEPLNWDIKLDAYVGDGVTHHFFTYIKGPTASEPEYRCATMFYARENYDTSDYEIPETIETAEQFADFFKGVQAQAGPVQPQYETVYPNGGGVESITVEKRPHKEYYAGQAVEIPGVFDRVFVVTVSFVLEPVR